jgi:alpha/beta superfamily hydrolase
MTRPVRPVEIEISGPAGPIEALLEEPPSARADAFVVICHPHPLYHGTMKNKVVHTVARAANSLQRPAVRFNFRGVGNSGGHYDNGVGETEDLMAVVDWGREKWPGAQLWLAGFSFGSYVALRAARAAAICSALPMGRHPWSEGRVGGLQGCSRLGTATRALPSASGPAGHRPFFPRALASSQGRGDGVS